MADGKVFRKKQMSISIRKVKPSPSVYDTTDITISHSNNKRKISKKDKFQFARLNSPTSKLPSTSDLTSTSKGVGNVPSSSLASRRSSSIDLLTLGLKKSGSSQTSPGTASRLSFSSVTKRVSTLLKFRRGFASNQGDQDKKLPSPPPEPMPVKPRFSAFMSAEAQFALLKGYEDILADKLVDQFPTERALIQRTKTPRHSIAISEFGLEHSKPSLWSEKRRSWGGMIQKDGGNELQRLNGIGVCVDERNNGTDSNSNNIDNSIESGDKRCTNTSSAEKDQLKSRVNQEILTSTQCERVDKQRSIAGNADVMKDDGFRDVDIFREDKASKLPQICSPLNGDSPLPLKDYVTSSPLSNRKSSLPSQDQPTYSYNLQYSSKLLSERRVSSLPDAVLPPSHGLQRNLSHDRLLMMTHRIEKAMDILDALRPGSELALSPRVKCVSSETDQRQQQPLHYPLSERRHSQGVGTEPVRDFKRWAGQWSREFRVNSTS